MSSSAWIPSHSDGGLHVPSWDVPSFGGGFEPYVPTVLPGVPVVPVMSPAAVPVPRINAPNYGGGLNVGAAYGQYIPLFMGHHRIPCVPLWLQDEVQFAASGAPVITFAVMAGYPIVPDQARDLLQVHANGRLIIDTEAGTNVHNVSYRFYPGSTTQLQDAAMVAADGADATPAYRRRAYIVIEDFPTEKYAGQIPAITLTIKDDIAGRTLLTDALEAYAAFKEHPGDLICEGLDDVEIDGLLIYDQDLPLKDFLAVHGPMFGFDYFERGADIVCARRVNGTTFTVAKTIDETDLVSLDDDGGLQSQYLPEIDLPDVMALGYYALEIDFQRSFAYSRTRNVNNPKKIELNSCFTITPLEALKYSWNALFRNYQEGQRRRLKLPPKHADIEPGDVLAFTYKSTDYTVRVTAAPIAADSTVTVECCDLLTNQTEIPLTTGYPGQLPDIDQVSAPVNLSLPVISGVPSVGQTLTASTGLWAGNPGPTFTYQWIWADTAAPIIGATATSYVVQATDVGHTLAVTVTATNAAGTASANSLGTDIATSNSAPTAIDRSHNDIYETLVLGGTVATLSGTDPDGDDLTFAVVDDPDDKFEISGDLLLLKNRVDYETATSHDVTIRATDPGGLSYEETFTFLVLDELELTGTFAATEGPDGASFAGSVLTPVTGTLAATDGADSASFTGLGSAFGTLAATDGADSASFAGAVIVTGTLAATDGADAASFVGEVGTNDLAEPLLYTGNGGTNAVTGVGFSPDLVIVKRRTTTTGWRWVDNVRGVGLSLASESNAAEATEATGLTSFDADGFTLGADADYNANTGTYLALAFQEVTNAFDIVGYTGTGANTTIAHGLGVAPEVMIVKSRASSAWIVGGTVLPATDHVPLTTTAQTTNATVWNNTHPTSSVFSLGSAVSVNGSGNDHIAYLFASKAGVSKFGTYTGTGNTSGATITTGFTPRIIITKRLDATGNWVVWDAARDASSPHTIHNQWQATAAESTSATGGITTSGTNFQITDSVVSNVSGGTYLYLAFA